MTADRLPRAATTGRCPRAVPVPRRAARLRALALLLPALLLPVAPLSAQVRLPALGESASAGMPVGAERRLGDQIWAEIRRDPSWLDDPVLSEYLLALWQPLVVAAMRSGAIDDEMRQAFAWQAFLIRDRSINAFALPGGYVGIHLGLIAGTPSRDELASVLAHELAHVSQRHIARSFESAGRQSALGLAAMLLGIIAASRSGNADVAQAAIAGGQAAMIQGQLNFSREMEREADRIGHQVLLSAGFSGAGMASMFDRLLAANRLNDSGHFPYLRSHPLTVERIAEARSRVEGEGTAPRADDKEHELMRARAVVLMQPSVEALRSHVQALAALPSDRPADPGMAYAAAIAATLLRDPAAARAALARLRDGPAAQSPATARWVDLLQLEVALADPAAGTAGGLAGVTGWGPPERWARPELLLRGRAWLAQAGGAAGGDAELRALHEALRAWLVRHPADGAAWELLARLEERRGNRLAMLRATAEANLAAGKLDAAIVTLQSAGAQGARAPGDDAVELAIIDSRLAELRRQRVARAAQR